MQDFYNGRLRTQEAIPRPYELYRREQKTEQEENGRLRDFEYFKSMYPARMKELQLYVEQVCDEMEYEGSPIYDHFPDRLLMSQMVQKIEERAVGAESAPSVSGGTGGAGEAVLSGQSRSLPAVTYGPVEGEESCRLWEMEQLQVQENRGGRPWGPPPPPPGRPWGPPPPPPPGRPWGPPPPPPPGRPWGPPPPPPGRPWRPQPPLPPGNNNWLQDILSILLFNELQGRRCRQGRCR